MITWDDSPTGQGPAGIAMRERHAVVFDDVATDPRFALWKDQVLACGGASITSIPLIHEERIFGVLTVKADRPHAFDLEEVELLSNLAADLARALQSLENEAARKRAEEALRASEEKFRLAFQTSPDSINLNRVHDGMFLDINEGFTKITGYTREEVIGKTSLELNIWDDPGDRQRLVAALVREGFVENMEARFRGKDGRIIIGLMSARILRIDQEDVLLSITRDITERKQAEMALRESEERFSRFFRASPVGTSITRLSDGQYADVNDAFLSLFGYTREEVIGQNPLELGMWADPEDRAKMIEILQEQGRVQDFETRFRRKSGEIMDVLFSAEVIETGRAAVYPGPYA